MKDIRKLEKAFRFSVETQLQKDIVVYLEALFQHSLHELLQKGSTELTSENRNLQVGELRILRKVIDVLKVDAPTYFSAPA